MKDIPIILQRGKMTYILYSNHIIVGVGGWQWTSYNQYENWNRQGITQYRKIILNSKEDEYTNAVEQMSLAHQCGIKGSGTVKPKDLDL